MSSMPMVFTQEPAPRVSAFWLLAIEGLLLIGFGVAAVVLPAVAGVPLTLALGPVLLAAGTVSVVGTITTRRYRPLGWSLLSGMVGLVAGLLILQQPLLGAEALVFGFALYLVLRGFSLFMIGLDQRRHEASAWWALAAAGLVDFLLGVFIVTLPASEALVVLGLIVCVDLVVGGVMLVAFGHSLSHKKPLHRA